MSLYEFTSCFSVVAGIDDPTDGFLCLAMRRFGTVASGALPRQKHNLANLIYSPHHRFYIGELHQAQLRTLLGCIYPVTLEDLLGHVAIDTLKHDAPSGHYPIYEEPIFGKSSTGVLVRIVLQKKSLGGIGTLIITFKTDNTLHLECEGYWTHSEPDLGGPIQKGSYACSAVVTAAIDSGVNVQAFNDRPIEALNYFWNINLLEE